MSIHDPKHPIWSLLRTIVISGTMITMCATLYKNGLDPKDFVLLASTLVSLAGFDVVKARVATGSQTVDKE